jgi:hypothetical protein
VPGVIDATEAIANEPRSNWELFARIAAPSFARSVDTGARLVATLRSTIVALRIERFRLANGRLPDSLNQLTDAKTLPGEPFTGEDLIYRRKPDGFYVYGLENGRDTGGEPLNGQGSNWGIHVHRPATRPAR